ncbi:MAG: hypothetical protein R3261_15040 [Alphaproteobacteria bacterium]|nr:hypothetical protein [Alphaproteobacteria bacterium]
MMLSLGGCGFQPLYDTRDGSSADKQIIQNIAIVKGANREGQILYNNLLDIMAPYGQPKSPDYTLSYEISISSQSLGVQVDSSTTRKNSLVSVSFTLVGDNLSEEFSVKRITGFSEAINAYATDVAEQNAIRKNLKEVAQDAKLRVSTIILKNQ